MQPALGREFTAGDDSPSANGTVHAELEPVEAPFGADPAIVQPTIYLDAKPYTVIGVMPEGSPFLSPTRSSGRRFTTRCRQASWPMINSHMFSVVGRLKPGVIASPGSRRSSLISRRIHDAHLDDRSSSRLPNSRPLIEHMVGDIKRPLYVLLAATGCLLLIACINVANLLVARAPRRAAGNSLSAPL